MVYIRQLKLDGFKSFGTTSIIFFDKKFTCLIGPTGSGKSNILKGIEFVLGSLSEYGQFPLDVIFQNRKRKKKRKQYSVEIQLDITRSLLSGESIEKTITRFFNDEGKSYYRVNGEEISFRNAIEQFSLPKTQEIKNLNILTKEKIDLFYELFLQKQSAVFDELESKQSHLFDKFQKITKSYDGHFHNLEEKILALYSMIGNDKINKDTFTKNLTSNEKTMFVISMVITIVEELNWPILLIDDVDRELEAGCVNRIALKLRALSRNGIKIIVVSHREIMMAKAELIWGVVSKRGLTQLWQMNLEDYHEAQGK